MVELGYKKDVSIADDKTRDANPTLVNKVGSLDSIGHVAMWPLLCYYYRYPVAHSFLSSPFVRAQILHNTINSVGNSHRPASPRPTTLEEDRKLFVDFSSILCLRFETQAMRTYNFFD